VTLRAFYDFVVLFNKITNRCISSYKKYVLSYSDAMNYEIGII